MLKTICGVNLKSSLKNKKASGLFGSLASDCSVSTRKDTKLFLQLLKQWGIHLLSIF
jgi:hypothetical protein